MSETPNPPIIQYWHSEERPTYIEDRLASIGEGNPGMSHMVFDEQKAAEFIAERFGPRHLEAFGACAVPAMQADYFRYCAVYALGGIWVDADFAHRRPLGPLLKDSKGHLFERARKPVLNDLFAFEAGHLFLAMAIEVATINIENQVCDSVELTTGPGIFSALVRLHRNGSFEAARRSIKLDPRWDAILPSYRLAIERHGPIEKLLEGVTISSFKDIFTWVREPEEKLAYKYEEEYWTNWKGTIFRPSRAIRES